MIGYRGHSQVHAITFEEVCEIPDAFEQICDGRGSSCFTRALGGADERKTLHCFCGDGVVRPQCPTEPPVTSQPQDENTVWIYPAAIVPAVLAALLVLAFCCFLANRRKKGHDRFLVETRRTVTPVSTKSSDTASRFSIATRFHPDYRHNWRPYMAPGSTEVREESWAPVEAAQVENLHRRRHSYGRPWQFSDFEDRRESSVDGSRDDTESYQESETSDFDYTRQYYLQDADSSSFSIPRPYVTANPSPFRMPQIMRGPRLRDSASATTMSRTEVSSLTTETSNYY